MLASCGGGGGAGSSGVPATPAPIPSSDAGLAIPPDPDPGSDTASVAQGDTWSTFQHDMARSGFTGSSSGIAQSNVGQLTLNWVYHDTISVIASPIVVAGTVYVADEAGWLTALKAADGTVLWRRNLGGKTEMTPTIADGMLFIGVHNEGAPSALYAIDPPTGNILWTQTLPGPMRSSPAIVNGMLYVGTSAGDSPYCFQGGVHALIESTGAPGPSWLTDPETTPNGGGVWGPVSTDGQNLYFGTGNTCTNEPAQSDAIVSTSAGMTLRWANHTGADWLDDDVGGGVLLVGGYGFAISKNGSLYAVNLTSGRVAWAMPLGASNSDGGYATPAYTQSTLIESAGFMDGTADAGTLVGLSPQGVIKWKIDSVGSIIASAATTSDLAFVELDNSIDAIDPGTGRQLWTYATQGDFAASPAIGPSGVFAADMSGTVYGFGLPGSATTSQRARITLKAAPSRGASPYKIKRVCPPSKAASHLRGGNITFP